MELVRRLDIGVASYRNPDKLRATLASIEAMSTTDWRVWIAHNPSGDAEDTLAQGVIAEFVLRDMRRFRPVFLPQNVGYAGAVNELLNHCETPYMCYLDNDVEIRTRGWDEQFCALMDAHPEVAQVFPGEGHYGFHNGQYHECLWNAGYCWAIRSEALEVMRRESDEYYPMDQRLGHHEEVDLMIRLRLAGYRLACIHGVQVLHHESSTQSPDSAKRIHAGVVRWMNKWNRYFCGNVLKYPNPNPDSGEGYDPLSLRYTDWTPDALYLERMTLHYFPEWNKSPRSVMVPGVGEMDVIEVLKPKGCYAGRAI